MRHISSGRLALVVSLLALVVAVGGTSYAALKIGTKQLKNNAVTSSKIKNGQVKSADIKDNNVTGTDVKESSLGEVPTAAQAGNSSTVNGLSVTKIFYRSSSVTPVVVFDEGGLRITAVCDNNELGLTATTTKNNSDFYSTLMDLEDSSVFNEDFESGQFGVGNSADPLGGAPEINADPAILTFAYDAPDGTAYTGVLSTDNDGSDAITCTVTGTVTGG